MRLFPVTRRRLSDWLYQRYVNRQHHDDMINMHRVTIDTVAEQRDAVKEELVDVRRELVEVSQRETRRHNVLLLAREEADVLDTLFQNTLRLVEIRHHQHQEQLERANRRAGFMGTALSSPPEDDRNTSNG